MIRLNAKRTQKEAPTKTEAQPTYQRVPGGSSWASAMFRFGADSLTYAQRLTQNLDRFYFDGRQALTAIIIPTENRLHLHCRGIHLMTLTAEDIERLRATAAYAFEDYLIERLRDHKIPEAFGIPLFREKV